MKKKDYWLINLHQRIEGGVYFVCVSQRWQSRLWPAGSSSDCHRDRSLVFPNEGIESHITMDEDALSRIQLMLHNYCSNQSSISSLLNIFSCLSTCWCSLSDSIVSNVCPHSWHIWCFSLSDICLEYFALLFIPKKDNMMCQESSQQPCFYAIPTGQLLLHWSLLVVRVTF